MHIGRSTQVRLERLIEGISFQESQVGHISNVLLKPHCTVLTDLRQLLQTRSPTNHNSTTPYNDKEDIMN